MPSCNGAKGIDVLDVAGSARDGGNDPVDLFLSQPDQGEHLGADSWR